MSMATVDAERVRDIAEEAKRLGAESGRDVAEIAAELAITNWKPLDVLTREARRIVASYYENKGDGLNARTVRAGRRDNGPEIQQAKAAIECGLNLAVCWFHENKATATPNTMAYMVEKLARGSGP